MCKLYFRNTYKNCKIMILYGALSLFFLILSILFVGLVYILPHKGLFILGIVISILLFVFFFFLLCVKNNDYKIKNYFRLNQFKIELQDYLKVLNPGNNQLKYIIQILKDNFLRFGTINNSMIENYEKCEWNSWIEDQLAFNYDNARYAEKLSFLTYSLYNSCASGSGFEGFFKDMSYEIFDN